MPYLDDFYTEPSLPPVLDPNRGIGQPWRDITTHPIYGTPLSKPAGGVRRPTRELGPEAAYVLDIMTQLQPGQAGLERQAQRSQAELLAELYRSILGPLAREEIGAGRAADVGAFEQFAPRIAGAGGTAAMDSELASQILADLRAGAELSGGERQRLQQSVRGAQTARGVGYGRNDAAAEGLAEYLAGSQLRSQRLGRAMDFSAVRNRASTDLFGMLTGRPPAGASFASELFGETQPRLPTTDPFGNKYAENLFGDALGQYWADLFSRRQKNAAENAATMQMAGAIASGALQGGGSAIGKCWVAREVFGADDPRWFLFRDWLVHLAPGWFRALYLRYGERFAAWLHGKPRLKTVIRWWMRGRIRRLMKRTEK